MKIQFHDDQYFTLESKNIKCLFNPSAEASETADFAMISTKGMKHKAEVKKTLELPGEFEIAGALINGFYTDNNTNVAYRVIMEDITNVHFGALKEIPNVSLLEELGDGIDIAYISLSEDFPEKKAKELIEKVEPRMVILGGDPSFFPKMVEIMGAKTNENNPIKVSRASLPHDKTEVIILPMA